MSAHKSRELRLSALDGAGNIAVRRDAAFRTLGFAAAATAKALTAIEDARQLAAATANPNIVAVLATEALAPKVPKEYGLAVSRTPLDDLYRIDQALAANGVYGESVPTFVAPDARVHATAYVAPTGVWIGRGAVIEPGAKLMEGAEVGDNSVIRAGAVIAADGFEVQVAGDRVRMIAHTGGVRLGNRVEVQANCTVDRGLFGQFTEIGDDSKLACQVHVAQQARIGKRCRIAAACVLGTGAVLGDDASLGARSVIGDGVRIEDATLVRPGSVVLQGLPSGQQPALTQQGRPATPGLLQATG
jgi:UDP-3-O-[3-hydroxymyristoyl] glucosamine N-acyltransferase